MKHCNTQNWCFQTLDSPLDSKEIKLINPKGNQLWIFIGRIDAEASILWPPDVKSQFIGKDSDAGKDWRQEEKGGDRGWDGWMTSLTLWTWVWTNSKRWWGTRKPGALQFLGLQRVKRLSNRTTTNVSFRNHSAIGLAKKSVRFYLPRCYVKTGQTFGPTQYFFQTSESHRVRHDWSDLAAAAGAQNSSHLGRTRRLL